jgi:ABC-2 type transport system permease protein
LFRSELRLVFGRRRNRVLLAVLALVPILIGVAVRVNNGPARRGQGPDFVAQLTGNGLFLVFTALTVALPVFLPLVVGIVSADTVAGEAGAGTLRYLLTIPVTRGRLLLAKASGAFAYAIAAVLSVALVGLVTGAVLFPVGRVTLLSGDTVSFANGLLRALAVALYVVLSLSGLVAIGLLISTLTEVPVAAMAATIGVAIVSAVLDAVPQLSSIHGALLTHHWLDFSALLRQPIDTGSLYAGIGVQAAYVLIAGSLAWARFAGADVTS